jgi:ribosome-associated protein
MAKSRAAPRTATRKKPARVPARTPAAPPPDEGARAKAVAMARLALDKKALDVLVLDVRSLASYAEYFVVMTAESDPQLTAIADYLEEKMKEQGERALGIEGARGGRWVLIDFGDVVAHVFYQDARAFYDLEGLWADAPRILVAEAP